MKLNHINLPVVDVAATRDFFTTFFGMKTVMELGRNSLAMMLDDGSMTLILSHFDKDKTAEVLYHKDFHVGFYQDSVEDVDATFQKMTESGLTVESPKRRQGRYGFYHLAPGGFEVEVAYLEKFSRSSSESKPTEPESMKPTEAH